MFIWLATHNKMLSKINLFERKLTTDELCMQCDQHIETTLHILWDSTETITFWKTCQELHF